jgi:hypothetical protein
MNLFQQASTGLTAAGASQPISVPASIRRLEFNLNISALAGTSPTITVFVEGQDNEGVWYSLYAPTVISTVVDTPQSIGPGMQTDTVIPDTVRVRWVIGGSAGQAVTCTMSLVGQPEGQ